MNKRIPTGISGLDEMLAGGFKPGSVNLVWGSPGVGKTTLGLEFLYRGALQGAPGLWISFEEFPHSLYRDATSLGWDLRPLEDALELKLGFTSPRIFLQSLQSGKNLLGPFPAQRVVVDSISQLRRITSDPLELRRVYADLVQKLKTLGVTVLLIGESSSADLSMADEGRISYLVDSIITLHFVEVKSAIQRAVVVLKMRGSDHAKEIRRFEIRRGGITVLEPFRNREGILSDRSHWSR